MRQNGKRGGADVPVHLPTLMAERNYSGFLSGSLGKGFSIGLRGSI
jgi:hypothetical protein